MSNLEKSNSNQRSIRVIKRFTDRYNRYVCINLAARSSARRELSGNAFKLYDYFCDGEDCDKNRHQVIVPSRVMDCTGMSESTYHRAFHELQEKKYITPDSHADDSSSFLFYE